ncbi:MAG: hypothetical protein D6785_13200 [Planctomycetota bacterium]|nr:MAG: hypothetical protein D6785_13200 [Planctomycetota bacterium]
MTWRYSGGKILSHFIQTLKAEKKILVLECPLCQRASLPPLAVYGDCYCQLSNWKKAGSGGT